MDIATIAGIIVGAAVIGWAISLGGSFMAFVDLPSVLVVIGGGFAATVIRFPLMGIGQSLAIGGRVAFTHKKVEPRALIQKIAEMGELVRRSGPLGLEGFEAGDANLTKGAIYIADGYDPAYIREAMELTRDQFLQRLSEGQRVFKSLGDAGPAFGMIGTIVGLVQMLGNMEDPSAIGPAMAVALLTTLYGAVLANLVCLPIADKLTAKLEVEEINQTLIIDGVLAVRSGTSPSLIREKLIAYLPENQHKGMLDEAA
ncbi:MotA/TolQ/ExbB proton channel family protein [Devosia algicola]|uniref:MotA/TolQ/ExbB proton channel family protein n=1 Tax=Devosia algicola TaxID=3026418 RepID=A0ABY7YMS3_9HYPH|nr:MotA/TolQ/ExbB proton channel family protein [Devosia algicola]WDR02609.1 MotA/TolQ/ExbB proton channel family protein [Devosia algicola]